MALLINQLDEHNESGIIYLIKNKYKYAIVAQLVAQRIRNAWVAGSSPASGFESKRKISLKSKENQGFPAVWGDFFVVLGVKDE